MHMLMKQRHSRQNCGGSGDTAVAYIDLRTKLVVNLTLVPIVPNALAVIVNSSKFSTAVGTSTKFSKSTVPEYLNLAR